jgi:uncharacterized metal-binding protein YceD (DUF177 family)
MSAVELNLDRLEPGRSVLEFDAVLVRGDQVFQGHEVPGFRAIVRGELNVDTMDQKILVHGTFSATREMLCDRTGEPFDMEYPVHVEVTVLRTPGRGTDADLGQEVGEDDNWVVHQQGGVVDLSEALLEAVVLDEPQHVVHPDHQDRVTVTVPDQGTEVRADEDTEEVDPRWDALRALRDDDNEDDSGPVRN